jgi:hypothetical protein
MTGMSKIFKINLTSQMMIRAIPVTIPTKVNMIPPLLSFTS